MTRLSGPERKRAVVETACRVFAKGSYHGSTTAEIARATGVTEPVLYRHFASKRDLYMAALDHVWQQSRTAWEHCLTSAGDIRSGFDEIGRGHYAVRESKIKLAELWVQALSEAGEDPELRDHLRRHMREVHEYIADVIRRGQADGVLHPDRDPEAEAWIFMAGGFLGMVGRRVGLVDDDDVARIRAARLEWMRP